MPCRGSSWPVRSRACVAGSGRGPEVHADRHLPDPDWPCMPARHCPYHPGCSGHLLPCSAFLRRRHLILMPLHIHRVRCHADLSGRLHRHVRPLLQRFRRQWPPRLLFYSCRCRYTACRMNSRVAHPWWGLWNRLKTSMQIVQSGPLRGAGDRREKPWLSLVSVLQADAILSPTTANLAVIYARMWR